MTYDIYVGVNNGTPTLWGSFVETSVFYAGSIGSTYTFSCKARDVATVSVEGQNTLELGQSATFMLGHTTNLAMN